MPDKQDIRLVYDRECPVCNFYRQQIDIAEGELSCINARDPGELIDELTAMGYDMDEGMVLQSGDELYFGSDAIHRLALLSSGKGIFNRIMSLVFRYPRVAAALYPLLAACRRLLLRLLGRSRINNLDTAGRNRIQ